MGHSLGVRIIPNLRTHAEARALAKQLDGWLPTVEQAKQIMEHHGVQGWAWTSERVTRTYVKGVVRLEPSYWSDGSLRERAVLEVGELSTRDGTQARTLIITGELGGA